MNQLHLRKYGHHYYLDPQSPLSSTPSLIFYLLSLLPLMVALCCFLRCNRLLDSQQYRYNTSLSPNQYRRKIIAIVVIILHSVAGLLATILQDWSIQAWMAYLIASIAFAVHIWVFQINKRHALFGACAALVFMVIYLQKLFHFISGRHSSLGNLVASELGCSVIWTITVLGQCLVHDARFLGQQGQTIFFWVASGIAAALLIIFNLHSGTPVLMMVTFLIAALGAVLFFWWDKWTKTNLPNRLPNDQIQ